MEFINTIELQLEKWFASVPHLPPNVRRWLSNNIWWILLVVAIVSLIGFGALLLAVLAGGALATLLGGVVGFALGGVALGAVLIASIPGLIIAALLLMSVSPLRARLAKGWRLVFLATLLDIAFSLIQLAFSMTSSGLFMLIVSAAVALYILFEIRTLFVSNDNETVTTDKPTFAPPVQK